MVLSNLEGLNAILNQQGIDKYNKLQILKKAAEQQLAALRNSIYTEEKIQSPYLNNKNKLKAIPIKGPLGKTGDLEDNVQNK